MNVKPAATFEAVIDTAGLTGLVGQVTLEANDNAGTVSVARSALFIEEIADGVYAATGRIAPSEAGQYTLIWRDGAGDVLGIEDLTVTSSAPGDAPGGDSYATVDDFFKSIQIKNPSPWETTQAERVLIAAAGEINSEIGLPESDALAGWQYQLAAEVNLERANEHWQQVKAGFGIVGLDQGLPMLTARDSWERHAHKLAPLKVSWGVG